MSNSKTIEIEDPSIADLAAGWSDCFLADMYRNCRSVLGDRNAWSLEMLTSTQESMADIIAELERRGYGWMVAASTN